MVVAYVAGAVSGRTIGISGGVGIFLIGSFPLFASCADEEFVEWAAPLVNAPEDRSPFDILMDVLCGIELLRSYSATPLVSPLTEVVLPLREDL